MHGHSGYLLILPCNRQIHFCICLKHSWRGKKKKCLDKSERHSYTPESIQLWKGEKRSQEKLKTYKPLGRYSGAGRDMITFHFLKKGFSFLTYGEKWLMWQGGKGVKKKKSELFSVNRLIFTLRLPFMCIFCGNHLKL